MLTLERLHIVQGEFSLSADWTLPGQALTAVVGPSGSGKSTLLSAIAGFVAPTSGRVVWQGQEITGIAPGDRPISMLFQDNNSFPHLTVMQNVGLGLGPSLRLSADQTTRVQEVLEAVGLAGLGHRKPGAMSGGQQSRAALARVLISDRPVVLLDEPFAALGPALKREMLGLVRRMLVDRGKSALMVTHSPEDAEDWADHVVLVDNGRADAPVATRRFFEHPPAAFRDYTG